MLILRVSARCRVELFASWFFDGRFGRLVFEGFVEDQWSVCVRVDVVWRLEGLFVD